MLSEYTTVYRTNDGVRREFYTMARSISHATMSARELIPPSAEIVRTYHDPNWK